MARDKLRGLQLQVWEALRDYNAPITSKDLSELVGHKDVSSHVTQLCKDGWARCVDSYERPRRYIYDRSPSSPGTERKPHKSRAPAQSDDVPDAYRGVAVVVQAAIGKELTPREVMVVHRTANAWLLGPPA